MNVTCSGFEQSSFICFKHHLLKKMATFGQTEGPSSSVLTSDSLWCISIHEQVQEHPEPARIHALVVPFTHFTSVSTTDIKGLTTQPSLGWVHSGEGVLRNMTFPRASPVTNLAQLCSSSWLFPLAFQSYHWVALLPALAQVGFLWLTGLADVLGVTHAPYKLTSICFVQKKNAIFPISKLIIQLFAVVFF